MILLDKLFLFLLNKKPLGLSLSSKVLDELNPSTRRKAEALILRAELHGIPLCVVSGYRSPQEQETLYNQGRTAPGKIVTNTKVSWHNFRKAFDVAILEHGVPTWPNDKALWLKIGVIGKRQGLIWGGDFPGLNDYGHFEYHPGQTKYS